MIKNRNQVARLMCKTTVNENLEEKWDDGQGKKD